MKTKTATNSRGKQHATRRQAATDLFTSICRADLGVECVKEYQFHPTRRWRYDYAIPEHKIALEVEGGVWTGGRHTSAVGFLGDVEKYNNGTLMGWRIFRTTPEGLYTKRTIDLIKAAINGADGIKTY